MGTLTKRPKTPSVQQFIRPAPTPIASTPISSATPTDSGETPAKSDDEIRSEVRQESLLRRSRGRLGTVLTGFRGLLSEVSNNNDQGAARKTLLGE